jgi:hypothetical protein
MILESEGMKRSELRERNRTMNEASSYSLCSTCSESELTFLLFVGILVILAECPSTFGVVGESRGNLCIIVFTYFLYFAVLPPTVMCSYSTIRLSSFPYFLVKFSLLQNPTRVKKMSHL